MLSSLGDFCTDSLPDGMLDVTAELHLHPDEQHWHLVSMPGK